MYFIGAMPLTASQQPSGMAPSLEAATQQRCKAEAKCEGSSADSNFCSPDD
jgi:hypothetical protein